MKTIRVYGFPFQHQVSQIERFICPELKVDGLNMLWGFRRTHGVIAIEELARVLPLGYTKVANENSYTKDMRLNP